MYEEVRKMRILFLMREDLGEGLVEGLDEGLMDMSGSQDQGEEEESIV